MDGDDDMFAGMDFVNSFSISDAEPQLSSPKSLDLHDFSDQALRTEPIQSQHKMYPLQNSLDTSDQKLKPSSSSIDSILAAYNTSANEKAPPSVITALLVSKQTADSSKAGVRRKRRSVKIGYGRTEDADEAKSMSSGPDDTASNGSAMDEHNISLPELISAANDEIRRNNGLAMSSDAFDDKQDDNLVSEPLNLDSHTSDRGVAGENVNEFPMRTLTPNALAGLSLAKEIEAENITQAIELDTLGLHIAEKITAEHMPREEPDVAEQDAELSSIPENVDISTEALSTHSNGHDIRIAAHEDNIDSGPAHSESEMDALDLEIKVPSGFSTEERLSFIQKTMKKNAECIQQRIATMSRAQKAAAQKRRQVTEKVLSASARFKEVEEEIEAACEREDFETAESLSETLTFAERAREAALKEFRAAEMKYDKYALKMQEVIQMQVTNEEKGFALLEQLGQDAADAANQLKKESKEKGKTKLDALTGEEETVKLKKKKLMLEVRVVEEAKIELSCAIENAIKTESQEKNILVDEREVFLQELDALMAAVRLKETQIEEHNIKIGDLEEKIKSRVAGFEKESTELKVDLQKLMTMLDSLERDSEDLRAQKNQVEADTAQAKDAAEKLDELSSVAKVEAQKLHDALHVRKAVAEHALSSKEKRLSLATIEKQHVEDANSLRSRSSSLRTSLQELGSERVKLHQELLSANQKISSIEKRGPELEVEKKLAAASRNFKEAGRLANEAKALLSSKEKLEADMKRVTADLHAFDHELESHMSELSKLENQLQAKEKEAAMARCERLRLLAAATRDERDAAAELEDFEEAESLHVEAEAADREAEELQKEFGFEGKMYVRLMSKPSTSAGVVDIGSSS